MTPTPDTSPESVARMLDGVTPGPWTADETDPADVVVWANPDPKQNDELIANIGHTVQPVQVAFDCDAANARFIAYAREAVPALALRVAELEADLCEMQTDYDHENREVANWKVRAEAAEAKLAASEARLERLRASFRVNMLRYGPPGTSHAEIDAAIRALIPEALHAPAHIAIEAREVRLLAALERIASADDPYEPCGWAIRTARAALEGDKS